jgi:hypothetical protein
LPAAHFIRRTVSITRSTSGLMARDSAGIVKSHCTINLPASNSHFVLSGTVIEHSQRTRPGYVRFAPAEFK